MKNVLGASAAFTCLISLALVSTPASADTVILKNGREIHGWLVDEDVEGILIRTGNGTIWIQKTQVASFMEDDLDGIPGPRPAAPSPLAEGLPLFRAAPGEWAWARGLTLDEIPPLTLLRDARLKELEELGPSKEELLDAVAVTPNELELIGERIKLLGYHRRQGSAPLRRRNAMIRLLNEFGHRALPCLVTAVGSAGEENDWVSKMASEALIRLAKGRAHVSLPYPFLKGISVKAGAEAAGLVKPKSLGIPSRFENQWGPTQFKCTLAIVIPKRSANTVPVGLPEIRWYLYHFEAPTSLIGVLARTEDVESGLDMVLQQGRMQADLALQAVSGVDQGFPHSDRVATKKEMRPLKREAQALAGWRAWWSEAQPAWKLAEEKREARIAELKAELERIRQGEDPTADNDGKGS